MTTILERKQDIESSLLEICKLGASPDIVDILAIEESTVEGAPQAEAPVGSAKPRRRARRKFFNADRGSLEDRALADFAADPNRFAGLPNEFFWTDVFTFPVNTSWSESHALEVWNFWKAEPGRSKNEVAMRFKKSLPKIRRALKFAEEQLDRNRTGD
ncbi:hypothetical protein NA78x_004090 [Anatilimnocola sp. NA78]|uniref:hypothetical protein n=1 Tax=Anatilimnocola sp. NA78 TaxID=3415683 RepID=UPI003CE5600C